MGIRPPCICGGRDARWPPAGPCCSPSWSMIRPVTPINSRRKRRWKPNGSGCSISSKSWWFGKTAPMKLCWSARVQRSGGAVEANCRQSMTPFSGGCSIPLEAQRLGLPAYGSDLNPVAVMIGKAMIEIPPKFKDKPPIHPGNPVRGFGQYKNAEGLAEDVKYYGEWMRDRAFERIGHLYPQVDLPKEYGGGKATVIAWIWARTVASPDPAFGGAHVPLISSYVLSSKTGKKNFIHPVVNKGTASYGFEIKTGDFSKAELEKAGLRTKPGKAQDFLCLLSGYPIPRNYIRDEGRSGRLGLRLIAVVAEGRNSRIYLPGSEQISHVAALAGQNDEVALARQTFLSGSTPTRAMITGGVCSAYGLDEWGKLFIDRQILLFLTLGDLLDDVRRKVADDINASPSESDSVGLASGGVGSRAYAESVSVYLAFAINRSVDRGSSICTWDSSPKMEALRNTFARQALPMTWDFAEGNPFSDASGNFLGNVDWVAKVVERFSPAQSGSLTNADAQTVVMPKYSVISTDPPYYDNIGYADLSDFFYCWMRRSLRPVFPDAFGVLATPKAEELVATQFRHGSKEAADAFFLDGMRRAITNMVMYSATSFPAAIYYAFKQSEIADEGISSTGWATFLQAVIEAGFAVVGTWPLRTEMANRMIASGTNALANSVVLVCRKKEATAEVITRAEFIRALKRELPPAIAELQAANIAPADMPQSAIGPGMGVFSRYKAVLESDDSPMSVKAALQLINRELDEYTLFT
ncbi:putative DNA methylase [uncultured Gammaproteobacteria bacterium]